jgi:hypothetical protein
MKAQRLLQERQQVSREAFVELRIWRVQSPLHGSDHAFKYALAYVVSGICVLRYDNEAGKGDHKHLGANETPYVFKTVDQILVDFWHNVDQWKPR